MSKNYCPGFCHTCGTGCAQYLEQLAQAQARISEQDARIEKLERVAEAAKTFASLLQYFGPPDCRWVVHGNLTLSSTLIGDLRMKLAALEAEKEDNAPKKT